MQQLFFVVALLTLPSSVGHPSPRVLYLPFTTSGPMIEEDAVPTCHWWWASGAITDSHCSWSMNGTVPQISSSMLYPAGFSAASRSGAGAMSGSNYYYIPWVSGEFTALDLNCQDLLNEHDPDFISCIAFRRAGTASAVLLLTNGGTGGTGYKLAGTATTITFTADGLFSDVAKTAIGTIVTNNALQVVCFGLNALTPYIKVNQNTTVVGLPGRLGTVEDGCEDCPCIPASVNILAGQGTQIHYEGYFKQRTPFTDALAASIQRRIYQKIGALGEQITVTRADHETYEIGPGGTPPTLFYAVANTSPITANGAKVLPAGTNLAKQSETLGTTWAASSVTVANNLGIFADGNTTMERLTSTLSTGKVSQSVTVTSSTGPFTTSGWLSATTGTAIGTVGMIFGSGDATGCTCWRSDGGACTTGTSTTDGFAYATVGTNAVRLSVTCSTTSATTSVSPLVTGGQYRTATGVIYAGGMQFEVGGFVTPYIPTTTASITRPADVVSVDNPLAKYSTSPVPWCIDVTATPYASRAWGGMSSTLMAAGTATDPNTWRLMEVTASGIQLEIVDSASAVKTWKASLPSGGTRRVTACYPNGTVWYDGASQSVTPDGAGTGTLSSQPATIYVGTDSAGAGFLGGVKEVKLCYPAFSPADCDRQH